jgi:hypothetical protein
MKFNKWTLGLAAVGVVSLASAARADEKVSQLQTALSNTTISGYVDTAATWRPGTDQNQFTGAPGNIPAYSYGKGDGFSLNSVDLVIDHPEDSSPWAAGYHVELMFGPDATPASAGPNTTLANITQAYVVVRTPVGNGIDWKVGVWDTIIGYEGLNDPGNPNYTRSYGYTIEPTTHTGILGTYKINDEITVNAGVADGSNVGAVVPINGKAPINGTATYESQKTFLGSIVLTAPSSWGWINGAALTLGAIDDVDSTFAAPNSTTSYYAGLTVPTPWSALKAGAAFDYLSVHSGGEQWVGGVYTTWQATDKLSLNGRAEYVDANSPGNGLYYANSAGVSDNAAEEATLTAQYNLWANVLSRVEVRWDHVEHGSSFGTGAFGAPDRSNDFMVALNLIYQF